jgi:hypothetical protein
MRRDHLDAITLSQISIQAVTVIFVVADRERKGTIVGPMTDPYLK